MHDVTCIYSRQGKIRRTENRSGDSQGYKLKKRSAQWSKRKDFKVMRLKYMSKNYSHLCRNLQISKRQCLQQMVPGSMWKNGHRFVSPSRYTNQLQMN